MSACIYCGLDAYNVIEVRYARTIKHASVVAEEEAPREVLGRGYYICDGCLALMDYQVEHHLDSRKHAIFNVLSTIYHLLVVWMAVAVGSAAGEAVVLKQPGFLGLGLVLAIGALVVWFLRASVHSQYYGHWRSARTETKPFRPGNSLGAMTDLRDRVNPELTSYLPVRWEDSIRLAALKGSPPIRCLGPNSEPWGEGPQTNFSGRGANEFYRLVWISWQLWPLTQVLEPEGTDWRPPPPPQVTEIEVAAATVFAAGSFAALALAGLPIVVPIAVAVVAWPIGFVVGRQARALWVQRKIEKSSRPVG